MKVMRIFLVAIGGGIAVGLIFLSQYGLFTSMPILEKEAGPYLLVYTKHIGDYKNAGLVMDELYNDLKSHYSIETKKEFGLYYDNPREVDKNKLRSIVGCIIEGESLGDLKEIRQKYSVKNYPSSKSVVTEFPYKGKISVIMGFFKIHPRLSRYIREKNYAMTPILEIYDQDNQKIDYIASSHLSKDVFENLLK